MHFFSILNLYEPTPQCRISDKWDPVLVKSWGPLLRPWRR